MLVSFVFIRLLRSLCLVFLWDIASIACIFFIIACKLCMYESVSLVRVKFQVLSPLLFVSSNEPVVLFAFEWKCSLCHHYANSSSSNYYFNVGILENHTWVILHEACLYCYPAQMSITDLVFSDNFLSSPSARSVRFCLSIFLASSWLVSVLADLAGEVNRRRRQRTSSVNMLMQSETSTCSCVYLFAGCTALNNR